MTHRRRNSKRRRNKSSPQTLSISKKHRQTGTEQVNETVVIDQNNTDTESIADKSVLSEIRSVVDPESESTDTDTVETYFNKIDQQSITMDNFGAVGDQDPDHEPEPSQSILTGNPGAFVNNQNFHDQNFHDPNLMPMPMNMPPQHMQHMMNMSHHMQPPPTPMIVQQKLSVEDVLRIALKVQELVSKDVEKIVEKKIALEIAPLQKEVDKLSKSLAKVQKELKNVKIQNDDLEQYSRRSCLRISGIAEDDSEDTTQLVLDLAVRCGANIHMDDIDRSHRVGKPQTQNNDDEDISDEPRVPIRAREIIVKFRTHGARLRMLKGRAFFRERKEKIFINEDLTKTRKNLAFACRKLKKDTNSSIVRTWIYNGNVFIQDSDENKVRVSCLEDLDPYKPDDETNGQ